MLDYGVSIDPATEELRALAKPHQTGFVSVHRVDGGTRWYLAVKPEIEPDSRERFAEWCWLHIQRFLEHGPEPDGWQQRSDGGWQLYAAELEMPGWQS